MGGIFPPIDQSSRRLSIIWTAVLSHHRTCRSAYGGSVTCVQFIITDEDIVISHLNNAFVCQGSVQYPTLGYMPIPLRVFTHSHALLRGIPNACRFSNLVLIRFHCFLI